MEERHDNTPDAEKRRKVARPKKKRASGVTPPRETVNENGEEIYCICRKPDNGRWMIACDFCDDWFHGDCVKMDEKKARLVVKFSCPLCIAKNKIGLWKRRCRLNGCFNPVPAESKYCCRDHGIKFMKDNVHSLAAISVNQVAGLIRACDGSVTQFKQLGSQEPLVDENVLLKLVDQSTLDELEQERTKLKERLIYLGKRKNYIKLAKDRAKRISEEYARELGVKKRDTCAVDYSLINGNDEWLKYADADILEGREGVCLNEKKKCPSHGSWQVIMLEAVVHDEEQCNKQLQALDDRQGGLLKLAKSKLLSGLSSEQPSGVFLTA